MIDHRGAVNTVLDVNATYSVTDRDRVLGLSSMSFDLSVYDVFGILGAGGAVVLPDAARATDPAHWCDLVARERVTVWNTVPALMGLFVEAASTRASSPMAGLRLCMMSGDWIPVDLPTRVTALAPDIRVVSLGGATEASIWSIWWNVRDEDSSLTSVPYGLPMRNQRWFVMNEAMVDCPDAVVGELYIGGVGVAKGYWRDEAKTRERFVTHPRTGERIYKTGDLGRYHPEGWLEFLGREDGQVKVQGYRIELGEIEAALEAHPDVVTAAVCAAGERFDSKRLVAFYVAAGDIAVDSLRTHLGRHVPAYMVPPRFVRIPAIPLSQNGKVDRRALLAFEAAEQRGRPEDGSDDPVTPLDEVVLGLCAEALEVEELGMLENFFERGGDSVRAARLVHRLRELLGAEISLRVLFADPTPRALSAHLALNPACCERAVIVLEVAEGEG
jgi:acyl-coenzyme A synthetase/AMP-(fatty) acid ligase/aryl carrier-like protein